MGTLFPIGKKVKVTAKSSVPVAGSGDDHTGKTGTVRSYADLAKEDVIHIVDLDEPLVVPDGTPNPPAYGPNGPTGQRIHGDAPRPDMKVDWIEVPASCLS